MIGENPGQPGVARKHEDQEWIVQAGENGWVVVTQDERIRKVPAIKLVLMKANVTVFLTSPEVLRNQRPIEQLAWVAASYLAMQREAARAPRGTHFRITVKGTIERLPPLGAKPGSAPD